VAFHWVTPDNPTGTGTTIWNPFKHDTSHFAPSSSSFMINFRVDDLDALLAELAAKGVPCVGEPLDESYGKFGWVMDPDGIKIELWQPKDAA